MSDYDKLYTELLDLGLSPDEAKAEAKARADAAWMDFCMREQWPDDYD